MLKLLTPVALGLALWTSQAPARAAEAQDGAAPVVAPTCRKAEVNPVTGHVLCIDPLGAAVEAPPAASEVNCQTEAHPSGAWTWGPKCKSIPEG